MAVTAVSVLPNEIPAALERIRMTNCSPLAGTYVQSKVYVGIETITMGVAELKMFFP